MVFLISRRSYQKMTRRKPKEKTAVQLMVRSFVPPPLPLDPMMIHLIEVVLVRVLQLAQLSMMRLQSSNAVSAICCRTRLDANS